MVTCKAGKYLFFFFLKLSWEIKYHRKLLWNIKNKITHLTNVLKIIGQRSIKQLDPFHLLYCYV